MAISIAKLPAYVDTQGRLMTRGYLGQKVSGADKLSLVFGYINPAGEVMFRGLDGDGRLAECPAYFRGDGLLMGRGLGGQSMIPVYTCAQLFSAFPSITVTVAGFVAVGSLDSRVDPTLLNGTHVLMPEPYVSGPCRYRKQWFTPDDPPDTAHAYQDYIISVACSLRGDGTIGCTVGASASTTLEAATPCVTDIDCDDPYGWSGPCPKCNYAISASGAFVGMAVPGARTVTAIVEVRSLYNVGGSVEMTVEF